jgi:PEP-CTERM motif
MSGDIKVSYDYFSVSPTDTLFNSGLDSLGSSSTTVPASVTTAVPEPTTYALLCISLGVVGFVRKARRQKL